MPRKGKNIFKRKDGRWEARYIKGYDLSGKARYGFCYGKTYDEARKKAELARAACINGNPAEMGNGCLINQETHFALLCGEWLMLRKSRVRESTFVKYTSILEKHICPKMGMYRLREMNAWKVEMFKTELLASGLAPKTVKDILVVLSGILRYAAREYPGAVNAVEIVYPKEIRQETRVLSTEEQQHLIRYLLTDLDSCKFGVLLAMLTGIRIGELCALRWSDIRVNEHLVRISSTMQRLRVTGDAAGSKTRVYTGIPKSDASLRSIPLPEILVHFCRKMEPENPMAYVLTGTEQYMEPRTLQYRLKKYMKDCGLEGVHFHTLRHTFATRCVEEGFELKSLSEIMGHSSPGVTISRYVHSSMELKKRDMEKLSGAIMGHSQLDF